MKSYWRKQDYRKDIAMRFCKSWKNLIAISGTVISKNSNIHNISVLNISFSELIYACNYKWISPGKDVLPNLTSYTEINSCLAYNNAWGIFGYDFLPTTHIAYRIFVILLDWPSSCILFPMQTSLSLCTYRLTAMKGITN